MNLISEAYKKALIKEDFESDGFYVYHGTRREFLDSLTGISLGSDAFFPFGDNIERAKRSGVSYIAEPGGSVRDDNVIEVCNKYNMTMCFTGMRLFHH